MKYEIINIQTLGTEVAPCYKVTVRQIPNLFQKLLGEQEKTFECVSDLGSLWYKLPNYETIPLQSSLDKCLISIPQEKHRKAVRKLFESICEWKAQDVLEHLSKPESKQKMN